jgi:hypothetical protein
MRATGTAFAILYEPRATPGSAQAPKKTEPKPRPSKVQQAANSLETPAERRARMLQSNSAPQFNVPITTTEQADRTRAIQGRAL